VRRLDPAALGLAQALAVLGDDRKLRHAAATTGLDTIDATRLAASLVRLEVLAGDDPLRFIHPVIRGSLEASLPRDERDLAHRSAALWNPGLRKTWYPEVAVKRCQPLGVRPKPVGDPGVIGGGRLFFRSLSIQHGCDQVPGHHAGHQRLQHPV